MTFVQSFNEHLKTHPQIAAAYEEYKSTLPELLKQWPSTASNPEEWYKVLMSNFMH